MLLVSLLTDTWAHDGTEGSPPVKRKLSRHAPLALLATPRA